MSADRTAVGGSTMNERWTVEELDGGHKHMIRNEDRRCIAIVSFPASPDVFDGDVLQIFANSNRMLAVCEKLAKAWKQGGDQSIAIDAAVATAAAIVDDIENKGDAEHE